MSGDHNMYCSGNQPDIVERLRETSAEIVKDTLPRWKNLDEYMDEAADEIERLQKELKTERVLSFRNEVAGIMFNLVELRNLATDKKYSTVRVASKELLSLINEIELLREQLFNAEQQIFRVEKERDEQLAAIRAKGEK